MAWELGSNFAHLSRLLPVALALRGRGHQVQFVVRELPRGQTVLGRHGFSLLQAPVWLGRLPPMPAVPSYAGVIRRCGFHAAPALAALVEGWRRLYELWQPDLVVLEHAPTAALAARCCGVPTLRYGTGWSVPPAISPLPCTTPWSPVDPRVLLRAETQTLGLVNAVLAGHRAAPLDRLTDLFDAEADILATFPETDHYGARAGLRYWGAIEGTVGALAPDWPAGPGERIFAFVEGGYDGLDALARDLAGLGLPAILYARDLPRARLRALSAPTLRVAAAPLDFERVARAARLVVCHAGHGTATGALRAGVPLLLLPRHAEQRLLTHRLATQGLALGVAAGEEVADRHGLAIRRLLDAPAIAEAARDFADRHAGHDTAVAVAGIADACEAALARRQPARPAALER